jgi:prepilin-type N-terminal cleavage/methylation domain-containing protein
MRCHLKTPRLARAAFTLIELLVVVALIVVIAAIGIFTIPLFQSQQKAGQNASQIVAWLGDAKVQALKQQRPTGIRFVVDTTDPGYPTSQFIRELYYVQTPDDYTGSMLTPNGRLYQPGPNSAPTMLQFSPNVDFFGGLVADPANYPVQPGDYLEINGGGLLYQIIGVPNAQTLNLSRPAIVNALASDTFGGPYTTNWRIIRQPRRLPGEDSLTLTGSVAIDFLRCSNVPGQSSPGALYYDILFAPNGGVVGKGTLSNNRIILWVRDSTKANPLDNDPVLISIQVRTGFIGTYQVDRTPGGDPYSFARDPRAGGM